MDKKLEDIYDRAKLGIMSEKNSTFICTILFSLKHSWTTEVPTAGTDGLRLLLNPDWFKSLTPGARIGLLAHEAWHVAFNHVANHLYTTGRGDDKEPVRYNKAGDYVINIMLQDAGYELPPHGLVDESYRDMSTNEVYDLLPPEPPGNGGGGFQPDLIPPEPGKTPEELKNIQAQIEDTVIKAATQSKASGDAPGTVPGEIQIVLDELLNPKLDWRTILQNYLSSFAKEDYSYRKPNRRFMPDYYLPSLYSESLGEIAFAVDTSGSVTDAEFTRFLSEIHAAKELLNPSQTTIIDFDTSIRNVHILGQDDGVQNIKFTGRGGTNLQPVFDHYDKTKPVVLVVFSDLYCREIEDDPGYPVVWVCVENPSANVNFGTLIHLDKKDI